jgi:hypothetical protein
MEVTYASKKDTPLMLLGLIRKNQDRLPNIKSMEVSELTPVCPRMKDRAHLCISTQDGCVLMALCSRNTYTSQRVKIIPEKDVVVHDLAQQVAALHKGSSLVQIDCLTPKEIEGSQSVPLLTEKPVAPAANEKDKPMAQPAKFHPNATSQMATFQTLVELAGGHTDGETRTIEGYMPEFKKALPHLKNNAPYQAVSDLKKNRSDLVQPAEKTGSIKVVCLETVIDETVPNGPAKKKTTKKAAKKKVTKKKTTKKAAKKKVAKKKTSGRKDSGSRGNQPPSNDTSAPKQPKPETSDKISPLNQILALAAQIEDSERATEDLLSDGLLPESFKGLNAFLELAGLINSDNRCPRFRRTADQLETTFITND